MKKLLKNGSIYFIGQIILSISSFFLIPMYSKILNQNDFGYISIFLISTEILGGLIFLGVQQALGVRFFKNSKDETKKSFTFIIYFSFFICSILLLFNLLLIGKDMKVIVFKGIFYIFSFFIYSVFIGSLRWEEKSMKYLIFTSTYTILKISLIVLNVSYLKIGKIGVIDGMLYTTLLYMIFALIYMKKKYHINLKKEDLNIFYSLIKLGISFIPIMFLYKLLTSADQFIMKYYSFDNDIGIYSFSLKFSNMFYSFLIIPLTFSTGPIVSRLFYEDKNKYLKMQKEILIKLIDVFFILILFGFIWFKDVYMKIIGNEFHESFNYIYLLVISQIIVGFSLIIAREIQLKEEMSKIIKINIFVVILNIILNLYFIKHYHILGAVLTTFISNLIVVLYYSFETSKTIGFHKLLKKAFFKIIMFLIFIRLFYYFDGKKINFNTRILIKFLIFIFFILINYFTEIKKKLVTKS